MKYQIKIADAPPLVPNIPRLGSLQIEGCLGCLVCVKRESCIYDVYQKREFDPRHAIDTGDGLCIHCMRCVQECKKNILSRAPNPQFAKMGDSHWRPELIAGIWKQAETGSIPVSGAGYGGPFASPGFDEMWTDMSEIVRPTRDGIHGREFISTVINLGGSPEFLEFSDKGELLTELPPTVEIPVPLILDLPPFGFMGDSTRQVIASAARDLQVRAVAPARDAAGLLAGYRSHLIMQWDPRRDDPQLLQDADIIEMPFSEGVLQSVEGLRADLPGVIVSVRLPLDEHAAERAADLASAGAGIIHLQADHRGYGLGKRSSKFATTLVKEVHFELLERSQRHQVTILFSGGIAMAEHAAKIIACGADGAGVDLALLVAMQCRVCSDCAELSQCPVELDRVPIDWGAQRIVNLIGSWHAQLIEVLGAMGLREVRRLRGELGRVMFFQDLERDSFAPHFGKRVRPLGTAIDAKSIPSDPITLPPELNSDPSVLPCPSRFRNQFGQYRVVRMSGCIACGKCAEVCAYSVFTKGGGRMLSPKPHLCRGPDFCRASDAFCVDFCPENVLRVGEDPSWEALGDARWTADLLVSTWKQAETGRLPDQQLEYRIGDSGGGLDRMTFRFPAEEPEKALSGTIDLSIPLNRRNDGRPETRLGIPFYGGGMSFGSVSLATMLARARAFQAFDSFTCTGEGGYPEALKEYADHVITQVATGLFGVTEETIKSAPIVEFKYAQGAKPGLGGHLLGDKVTNSVARLREAVEGSALFSPFPFHSVYSVEDHKKHVDWIQAINPEALISVKVSGASDVDMVAVGSYYAGAHIVHIDGSYGGTGAAPDIAKKNIAMPIEYAILKVHEFLQEEGIREEITLIASGGIRTAWDLAKTIALGADGVVTGTAELVALECVRCGVCESGRGCPRGIATTDPDLAVIYEVEWATQRLLNLFASWTAQLRGILSKLGMRSIHELVGRTDVLEHLDYEAAAVAGKRLLK